MNSKYTSRGFALVEFRDTNGVECSLQQSSIATDDRIWLGPSDPNPKRLVYNEGWLPTELPDDVQCTTRMHLDREQAAALIPLLQHFVDTGTLPSPSTSEGDGT